MSNKPYIGLRPFERNETELFFGREQHTDELIDRLGSQHFLAVIGNSGCGKSSLVKTGLIAGLEAGFLATASSYWRIVEMRPGNHPFQALAEQLFKELSSELSADFSAETLQQRLRLGSLSLHELLAEQPLANNAQLLIVCDQFEELFRYAGQCASIEAGNFVSLLLASSQAYPISANQTSHSIYVVITMRSDFLGDCAQFAGLAEAINQGLYLTPRLNTQQLRAAIEEPALVCEGEIEPALISQLLEDAETNPDQLPLLQHVLMRLWDLAGDNKHITLDDYAKLEGLGLALSKHADEAFLSLSKRQQKLAKNLFCQLTGHDSEKRDTRRPLTLGKLVRVCNKPYTEVVKVLDVFRQSGCGFLLPPISQSLSEESPENLEKVIDISHESLIRQWQRLTGWVQEEVQHAETYQRLADSADRWQSGEAALLQSPELEAAVTWLNEFKPTVLWAERYASQSKRSPYAAPAEYGNTDAANARITQATSRLHNKAQAEYALQIAADELSLLTDYIHQSQAAQAREELEKHQAQQRQLKQARLITGISVAGLLIAAALATWAITERKHAEKTEQRRTTELYQSQLTHASLLAKGEDYLGAKKVLAETYKLDKDIAAEKQHQRNLLASFADMKGGEAEQVYQGAGYPLLDVAVSPDGQLLAAAGEHGTLVIFDVKTGQLLQRLQGHATEGEEGDVWGIVFTANGEQLISAGDDKKIIVWQRGQDQLFSQKTSWPAAAEVNAIALSPDGLSLARGGDDNNISLWDLATGKLKTTLKKHSQTISVGGLSFNATGELLASASYDGTAIVWQVATGKPVQVLQGHSGAVLAAAFSADSQTLVTGGHDKTVRLWTLGKDEPPKILNGHANNVFATRFVGTGDTLLSASADRTLRLWDSRSGVSLRLWQGHTSGITSLASHADQVFSASKDGTVRRWRLALPYQQALPLPNEAASNAISPDLATVAVGYADGALSLYDAATELVLWRLEHVHKNFIQRLAFNNVGNLLATGSFDHTAKIWRLSHSDQSSPAQVNLQEQSTLSGHSAAIHAIAFSPDNQTLASASYDGSIGLFPLSKPAEPQFIKAHEGRIATVSFNAAGTQLLSSGIDDWTNKWWDISTSPPTLVAELPKANDRVLWSSLSPDNQSVSIVGREAVVTVLNTQTQKTTLLPGHENSVYKSLFSPDSATLATVSSDGTVKFWNIGLASELFSLRLPIDPISPGPWDFDFRCQKICRVAVPLTAGKLLLYSFSYQDRLDFAHDPAEQKRNALALWQDYLKLTATLMKHNALPAAGQAYREAEVIGKPLRDKYPNDDAVQQKALLSFYLQAELQQRLGKIPEALSAYQQALTVAEHWFANTNDKATAFESLISITNTYAKALSTHQQSDKVAAIQQRVLALTLAEVRLLVSRAEWAKSLGYQTNVDKDLLQAATLVDKQNASELNSIGYDLATLSNRYQEAYPLLKQAITLKPDDANIMDSIGLVLFKLGKNQAALAYLQAADCKKDQLSKGALEELNAHTQAVLKAMGKTKAPPWQCQQVQVQVQKILPASQGERLGIQAGDVFISYNGKAVTNTADFIKGREQEKPGSPPRTLVVLRQGKTLSFAIKPGKIGGELKDIDNLPPLPNL